MHVPGNSSRSFWRSGTDGRTTPLWPRRQPASGQITTSCTRRCTRVNTSPSPASWRFPVRPRAILPSPRPDPRTRASTSPAVSLMSSSLRSRRLPQALHSANGSDLSPNRTAGQLTTSVCCLACRSCSAVQRPRRLPGGLHFTGTPEGLADLIGAWWHQRGADGFTLQPLRLPLDLTLFVDHVVPLLQARGITKRRYGDGTLRDELGLPRPTNAHMRVGASRWSPYDPSATLD